MRGSIRDLCWNKAVDSTERRGEWTDSLGEPNASTSSQIVVSSIEMDEFKDIFHCEKGF